MKSFKELLENFSFTFLRNMEVFNVNLPILKRKEMAANLVERALDYSSYHKIYLDDCLSIFSSAFLGNKKSLDRLGISKENYPVLNNGERMVSSYYLILEATKKVTGHFNKHKDNNEFNYITQIKKY